MQNKKRPQFTVSFNLEQVDDIATLADMPIANATDLKQAIQKLIPMAGNNKAGNPNFAKKNEEIA